MQFLEIIIQNFFRSFEEMNLMPALMENISKKGYIKPLPVQKAAYSAIKAGIFLKIYKAMQNIFSVIELVNCNKIIIIKNSGE